MCIYNIYIQFTQSQSRTDRHRYTTENTDTSHTDRHTGPG